MGVELGGLHSVVVRPKRLRSRDSMHFGTDSMAVARILPEAPPQTETLRLVCTLAAQADDGMEC
jgi:hypothetical protein